MAVAAVVVALFALLPLGFVVWVAVHSGWDTVYRLVVRPRVGELLINTGLLVLLTVPLCVVLAMALAWLTELAGLSLLSPKLLARHEAIRTARHLRTLEALATRESRELKGSSDRLHDEA